MRFINKKILFIFLQFHCLAIFGQVENKIHVLPATENLFMRCGNRLKVSVDSISPESDLSFSIEGGSIQSGDSKNEVIIYPCNRQVVLRVFNGTKQVGSKEFKVRLAPLPAIAYLADNVKVNNTGIPRDAKILQLKAVCDSAFVCFCPRDNLYKISYRVVYKKNEKILYESNLVTDKVELNHKWMKKADTVSIELGKVKKITSIKEESDMDYGALVTTLPLL